MVVTDTRTGSAGWVASAVTTNLTAIVGEVTYTIPKANITYTPNTATKTGTVTVTTASAGTISTARAVQTATGVDGNNTATWNPSVVVAIPSDAISGNYTGTITHSVV